MPELTHRWNGWGDPAITLPLPPSAKAFLMAQVGEATGYPDATLESILKSVPAPAIPAHPLITTAAQDRLWHARGQSLADWIALRSGQIGAFPAGVAYPSTADEVRALLKYANDTGTRLIPFGGGTSVVGHINPRANEPTLTVDLSRLDKLLTLDETSRLATFEAGVLGPHLEKQLQARGYTLGHFPQSFEYSTLGGWVVTRSSGQQSYHYGRIEDLFAGGRVETLRGEWVLPPFPATAAGPDLRQIVLGSEGRLGIVTHATVRVRPCPANEQFHAVFFKNWETGCKAVRAIAQAALEVSMLRLSNALETETQLRLTGHDRLVNFANSGLRLLGYGPEKCMLLFGVTEYAGRTSLVVDEVLDLAGQFGGFHIGTFIGQQWRKNRFRAPYFRNTAWEMGYAIDTLETATPWTQVPALAEAVLKGLHTGLQAQNEKVMAYVHLSHLYPDGASLYFTYLYRRAADPAETLHRWQTLKDAASRTLGQHGGTISHQHGVGTDHAPYLLTEKGPLGLELLENVRKTLDPAGLLNPGKLLE